MNEETIRGNQLIADFVGHKIGKMYYDPTCTVLGEMEFSVSVKDMEYDSSWEWLMPVLIHIEKIGTYDYYPTGGKMYSRPSITVEMRNIEIYFHSKEIDYRDGFHIVVNRAGKGYKHPMYGHNVFIAFDFDKRPLIEAIWIAVVKLIELYNVYYEKKN